MFTRLGDFTYNLILFPVKLLVALNQFLIGFMIGYGIGLFKILRGTP